MIPPHKHSVLADDPRPVTATRQMSTCEETLPAVEELFIEDDRFKYQVGLPVHKACLGLLRASPAAVRLARSLSIANLPCFPGCPRPQFEDGVRFGGSSAAVFAATVDSERRVIIKVWKEHLLKPFCNEPVTELLLQKRAHEIAPSGVVECLGWTRVSRVVRGLAGWCRTRLPHKTHHPLAGFERGCLPVGL